MCSVLWKSGVIGFPGADGRHLHATPSTNTVRTSVEFVRNKTIQDKTKYKEEHWASPGSRNKNERRRKTRRPGRRFGVIAAARGVIGCLNRLATKRKS